MTSTTSATTHPDENERKDYEKKIEDKKAQIEELQKKVEAWTKQLADEKDMGGKRKDIGDQCVKNRIVVQRIFADVKAKVLQRWFSISRTSRPNSSPSS